MNTKDSLKNKYNKYIKSNGVNLINDKMIEISLFAPDCSCVSLLLYDYDFKLLKKIAMTCDETSLYTCNIENSSDYIYYKFELDNKLLIPNPLSMQQANGVHGFTILNPEKRIVPVNYNCSYDDLIIYELHVGTFTKDGTFLSAIHKLDYLVDLGITAVELMPIASFPGEFGWGYDGVLLFAPYSKYGSPDDLQAFINAAHSKGLRVVLDVVYNHFGPEGNYIYPLASSIFFDKSKSTPWGAAINFKNEFVREFFIQNTIYWLTQFGFDGLRFDAVHAIYDESDYHILEEIKDRIKFEVTNKHVILILENGDNNSKLLKDGYDAQWNDDVHHCYHIYLTNEAQGYYSDFSQKNTGTSSIENIAKVLTQGFLYQGQKSLAKNSKPRGQYSKDLPPNKFVNFLQNHDQIGNRAFGERLPLIAEIDKLKNLFALNILSPSIPLLFMGEEWGATSPFLFFSDLSDELKEAVKIGRINEFADFDAFKNKNLVSKIPDPTFIDTFEKSKLNWSELDMEVHLSFLAYAKELIKVRKTFISDKINQIDQSRTNYQIIDNKVVKLQWFFGTDNFEIYVNLSDCPVPITIDNSKIVYTNAAENKNQPLILPNSLILLVND